MRKSSCPLKMGWIKERSAGTSRLRIEMLRPSSIDKADDHLSPIEERIKNLHKWTDLA